MSRENSVVTSLAGRRKKNVTSDMQTDPTVHALMQCRGGCGACCIAPSISSAIPGMPGGKPAGVRCIQLTVDNRCAIFGDPRRPPVCSSLRANIEMCGNEASVDATRVHAMRVLVELERRTGQG